MCGGSGESVLDMPKDVDCTKALDRSYDVQQARALGLGLGSSKSKSNSLSGSGGVRRSSDLGDGCNPIPEPVGERRKIFSYWAPTDEMEEHATFHMEIVDGKVFVIGCGEVLVWNQ